MQENVPGAADQSPKPAQNQATENKPQISMGTTQGTDSAAETTTVVSSVNVSSEVKASPSTPDRTPEAAATPASIEDQAYSQLTAEQVDFAIQTLVDSKQLLQGTPDDDYLIAEIRKNPSLLKQFEPLLSDWQRADAQSGPATTPQQRIERSEQFIEKYFNNVSTAEKEDLKNKFSQYIEEIHRRKSEAAGGAEVEVSPEELFDYLAELEEQRIIEKMQAEKEAAELSEAEKLEARKQAMRRVDFIREGVFSLMGDWFAAGKQKSDASAFIDAFFGRFQSSSGIAHIERKPEDKVLVEAQVMDHFQYKERFINSLQHVYQKAAGRMNLYGFPEELTAVRQVDVSKEKLIEAIKIIATELQSPKSAEMQIILGQGVAQSLKPLESVENYRVEAKIVDKFVKEWQYADKFQSLEELWARNNSSGVGVATATPATAAA